MNSGGHAGDALANAAQPAWVNVFVQQFDEEPVGERHRIVVRTG